jgi:hypothetical protein
MNTPTDHAQAFPVTLLIVITVLLDCHSLFQMALGGTTWGINYRYRPAAATAVLLCCSISCNITAGIVIGLGGRRSRKTEEVEKRVRQALTEEAMARLARKREDEARVAAGEPVGVHRKIETIHEKAAQVLARDDGRQSEDAPLAPNAAAHGADSPPVAGGAKSPLSEKHSAGDGGAPPSS